MMGKGKTSGMKELSSYNVITGKYGVYFPCNGTIEETLYDDGDFELMES